MELFMALRYPVDVQGKGTPFVLFTSHRAKYKAGATQRTLTDNKSCALYMPPGFQVSDVMRYESASPGLMGGVAENLLSGNNDYSADDIKNVASTAAGPATQLGVAALGGLVGGAPGAVVAGTGASSAAVAVEAIRSKRMQSITNPQEFMLFKAPGVRQFSFTFNMIPRSARESDEVIDIIQYFRERMYPTLTANDLMYNFPEVFTINFKRGTGNKRLEGVPRIAEAALSNATTSFNPNSMSYFKRGNRPVEVGLTLSFQELMPLSQKNIKDGF